MGSEAAPGRGTSYRWSPCSPRPSLIGRAPLAALLVRPPLGCLPVVGPPARLLETNWKYSNEQDAPTWQRSPSPWEATGTPNLNGDRVPNDPNHPPVQPRLEVFETAADLISRSRGRPQTRRINPPIPLGACAGTQLEPRALPSPTRSNVSAPLVRTDKDWTHPAVARKEDSLKAEFDQPCCRITICNLQAKHRWALALGIPDGNPLSRVLSLATDAGRSRRTVVWGSRKEGPRQIPREIDARLMGKTHCRSRVGMPRTRCTATLAPSRASGMMDGSAGKAILAPGSLNQQPVQPRLFDGVQCRSRSPDDQLIQGGNGKGRQAEESDGTPGCA